MRRTALRKHFRDLYLPALSGAALWVSFPAPGFFPLAWLALVPHLIFCIRPRSVLSLIGGHLLLSLLYFGGVLSWIPRVLVVYGEIPWTGSLPVFLLLIVLLSLLLAPFTFLMQGVARLSPRAALALAPAFWVLTEIFRNYFPFNGFPWGALGYSQFPYKVVLQCLDIGGVYLLSACIVAVNTGVLMSWRRKSWKPAAAALLLLLLLNGYGVYRLHFWEIEGGASLEAGLVQGNVELAQSREYYAEKYFENLPALFDRAAAEGARWVILPEAQNPYYFPSNFYFRVFWQNKVQRAGAYLLFNAAGLSEDGQDYYNSVHLLGPDGSAIYRYDKTHLVPFGEYLPLAGILDSFEPLVAEVSSFTAGNDFTLGRVDDIPFATLICYESIFPELSRKFSLEGAQVLVNVTNDLWFGDTAAPIQHFQMASFRSIETRKPLIRVANSGITAVVDPWGRVRSRTGLFQEAVVVESVESNRHRTFYVRFGFWPLIGFIIGVSLIGMIYRTR